MTNTVVGIFDNESEAREAVRRLQAQGIQRNQIDLVMNRTETTQDLNTERNRSGRPSSPWDSRSAGIDIDDTLTRQSTTQTNPEFNRSADPDFSPTGSNRSTANDRDDMTQERERHLSGLKQTDKNQGNDSLFDRIGNFFSNLFDNDDDARRYTHASRNRTIVTVHAASPEDAENAADILDESGAVDVDQSGTAGSMRAHQAQTATEPGSYKRSTGIGRRSRIFNRPIEAEYRLKSDEEYDRNDDSFSDRKPLL
ncbi:MAG: hypothetical protein ACK4TA_04125 [Saprospiraceae bacterium]